MPIETHITTRELEIIQLIEQNLNNAEIANALSISTRTVETHRKNIYKKTNCRNALSLVKWAYLHKQVKQ